MSVWSRLRALFKSVTPQQLLPSWRNQQPQWSQWDGKKAILEGFKASEILYACTSLRAESMAALPWYVEQLQGDYEWERVPGDPLETLLEYPNEFQSRQEIFETLSLQLDLVGNAIMTRIDTTSLRTGTRIPSELYLIDPTNVQPIPDRQRFISGYQYMDETRRVIDAAGVIHFRMTDPANPYWGVSPLQSVARVVDTSNEAIRWNKVSLQNRAMPEVLFTTDQTLDEFSWEFLREKIATAYASPDNARTPFVTGNGMTAEVINWKPIEMDFVNSLHYYREAIGMTYKVPLTLISVMMNATEANVDTLLKQFWLVSMLPHADRVKATLNRALIPRAERGQRRICYDLSGVKVLTEDKESQVNNYAKLVQWGQPVNAAAKFLGMDLEDVVGGDVPFLPATQTPMDTLANLAEEQLAGAQATTANTEANTQTTLQPVPPAKDPNKPAAKPAA